MDSLASPPRPDPKAPGRLVLSVLVPSLMTVVLVSALAVLSVNILGAVRSYVGGESLWAKARGVAVQELNDFVRTGDLRHYEAFERALRVPLGDRAARTALQGVHPDRALARQGFAEGGNHPADLDGLIWLYLYFGDLPQFQEALAVWAEGDRLVDELRRVGRDILANSPQGLAGADRDRQLQEVDRVNDALIRAEKQFSHVLGEISRLTQTVLLWSLLFAAALLSALSIIPIRRTLHRQAEQQHALAVANERWRLAATVAELGLFEMDTAQWTLKLDGRASGMFGLGRDTLRLPTQVAGELIDPADQGRLREGISTVRRNGQVLKQTLSITTPQGEPRTLEAIGCMDESPHSRLLVGVIRDITDEKIRTELSLQRDAAQRVAASQREFLSRLSHELRTPLNAILGFAQLLTLDKKTPLPPAKQEQVGLILQAGRQLHSLVEDVMDLTKVEAGEIGMSLQTVDVVATLHACLGMVQPTAQRYEVVLCPTLPSQPVWVHADPHRLQQVFINLLTNGCKYNQPRGRVEVSVRHDPAVTRIDVRDNGLGMTPHELAQIFQPFKRVGEASARIEGTGLGLYIVGKLMDRMQGEVNVTSTPGLGSCFTIGLPSATAPHEQASLPL